MPRRMRGEGSVYQRSDGLWCGMLDLGYEGAKRRRKTVYAATQREAVRKLAAARRAYEAGTLVTKTVTVETWCRYWLEHIAAKKVKPATLATYRGYVTTHIIPTLGPRRLDRLTPDDVRALHTAVSAAGRSPTTALHVHRILSTALTAAMRDGKTSRNVAALVDAPRKAVPRRRALSVPEAVAVLRAASGDRYASRWLAALLLGARQGELLGLRWSYVDLGAGTVDLAWSLQRVRYTHGCGGRCGKRPASCPERRVDIPAGLEHEPLTGNLVLLRPKTAGSRRLVPLPEPLRLALCDRFSAYQDELKMYAINHQLVWCRADGHPVDAGHDLKAWKALLATAQVPQVSLHEARHTTVTLLMEAGVDPRVIATIVGHSDVATQRGYTHIDQRLSREALGRLALALT